MTITALAVMPANGPSVIKTPFSFAKFLDVIPASFEPSIDYVVTKIPRFAFEKFPQADSRLTTQMKSVGEVMAMGRTFQESLQKALQSLEEDLNGFESILDDTSNQNETLRYQLTFATLFFLQKIRF